MKGNENVVDARAYQEYQRGWGGNWCPYVIIDIPAQWPWDNPDNQLTATKQGAD